jgi:hypothetical protein
MNHWFKTRDWECRKKQQQVSSSSLAVPLFNYTVSDSGCGVGNKPERFGRKELWFNLKALSNY